MGVIDKVIDHFHNFNWPGAVVLITVLVLAAIFLTPNWATEGEVRALLEDQTKDLKSAIQSQSTTDAVHENTIETIHRINDRQDHDIRDLRRSP